MVSIEAIGTVGEQALNPWQGERGRIFERRVYRSTIPGIEFAPLHILQNCEASMRSTKFPM
jgi:hypothetical protein